MNILKSITQETGCHVLERLLPRANLLQLPWLEDLVHEKHVVQVSGSSCSGKSLYLTHVMVEVARHTGSVLFLNCDGHIKASHLAAVANNDEAVLDKIFIASIYDFEMWQNSVPSLVSNILSENRDICCLVVDSMSAFYHEKRMSSDSSSSMLSYDRHVNQQLNQLLPLSKQFNVPIMYAKQDKFNSSSTYSDNWNQAVGCKVKLEMNNSGTTTTWKAVVETQNWQKSKTATVETFKNVIW